MRKLNKLNPRALSWVMSGGTTIILGFMFWVFYRTNYNWYVLLLLATSATYYHIVARSISKLTQKGLDPDALRSEAAVILAFGVAGSVASLGAFLVYLKH